MYSRISAISEWDSKTLSLILTSVLPVTCYVPVLWPEIWLQNLQLYFLLDCGRDYFIISASGEIGPTNSIP